MAEPCFIEQATKDDVDKAVTPEFANAFWRYTKANYSEQGIPFHEALPKLAAEFKIPQRVVSQILDTNKTVRVVTEELAKVQRQNRKFLADNRRYIANNSKSDVAKVWSMLEDGVRGTLLGGHGPVIGGIHPIDQAFTQGRSWEWLKAYGRAFKAVSPASLDEIMGALETKERYQKWQDAGLPIGRKDKVEGFKVSGWGGRAMEVGLKPLMYEYAERLRENSPPELRDNPEMMKDNAAQAAHATGAMLKGEIGHGLLPRIFNSLQLAPALNASKWMKTVLEPAKTLATYTQSAIAKASRALPERFQRPMPDPVARQAASNRMWQAGKWFAGMAGGLVLNDQINRLMGSRSRVNFTDPKRPDYMSFRVNIPGLGDYYIKPRGSMEIIQLVGRLLQGAKPYAHGKYGERTPEEIAGRYFEYKATPSLSLTKEITTGKDVFGRPVPWSSDPGTKYAPRYSSFYTGENRFLRGISSPEYWMQHAPIFLGHGVQAFYEGMRESGINPSEINSILRGLQQHPEILGRAGFEGASEFLGLNPMHERGKPYQIPQTQRKLEQYLPSPVGGVGSP